MEGGGCGVKGVEEAAWSARGWEVDGGRIHSHRGGRRHRWLLCGWEETASTTTRVVVRWLHAEGAWRVGLLVTTETLLHARETPGERPSPFGVTSGNTLRHRYPVRGIVVVSLLSMVESSCESHALVPRTGDGVPSALQPLEKRRLEVIPNLLVSLMEKEDGSRYRGAVSATCVECGDYGVE
uniref:Uncharacterized protein n=1 Tax=Oryza punctata TaxID=4537 RepID=A0A0E0JHJ3_ORYPU